MPGSKSAAGSSSWAAGKLFVGNIDPYAPGDDFTVYAERLGHIFRINGITDDAIKASLFLSGVGTPAYIVLRSAVHPVSLETKSYDELIGVLKEKYSPKASVIAERFQFYRREQQPEESVRDFVMELHRLAEACEFGQWLPWTLRDRLVLGLRDEALQRILVKKDASFEDSVKEAVAVELSGSSVGIMKGKSGGVGAVGAVNFMH